ncbi:MAG: hypothetical protein ACE5K2_02630 [Candidatus Zixiibacteriota bacterium]
MRGGRNLNPSSSKDHQSLDAVNRVANQGKEVMLNPEAKFKEKEVIVGEKCCIKWQK